MSTNATARFTDRVADYIRYRPDYPPEVMAYLKEATVFSPGAVVADIGSGTGIFTRHLLEAGYKVYAVEPNGPMRIAAEAALNSYSGFVSIDGSAGGTNLPDHEADLIVCAQAFHWFNTPDTKVEFQRIAKPDAYVALIWNNRITDADPFAAAYEHLLQNQSRDYKEVNHQNLTPSDFKAFFKDGIYERSSFANEQIFDAEGLAGRAFSSSYVPAPQSEAGQQFALALQDIFRKHEQAGMVRFRYATEVYLGRI